MSSSTTYTMSRYLLAKRTVDDRALYKDAVQRLGAECQGLNRPVRVLEIGAGLATMLSRLVDWNILRSAEYTVLDVDPTLLTDAQQWLRQWAGERDCSLVETCGGLSISGDQGLQLEVRFVTAELGRYLADAPTFGADLLIANAFLDLVDVPAMLPDLFALVAPGGLYWFSVNFDGLTSFEPSHPDDEDFMRHYHQSMDCRERFGRPAGDSQTGRHLFGHLREVGATVLCAGSSDWVVFPQNGAYQADEAYFLHHLLETIEQELSSRKGIEEKRLQDWTRLRHSQVDQGQLVIIVHQIDMLGNVPATPRTA